MSINMSSHKNFQKYLKDNSYDLENEQLDFKF